MREQLRWFVNLGEDGWLAWWRTMPWRCRFGFHKPGVEEWREIPDYPFIVRRATVCTREGCDLIFDIEEP